MGSKNKESTIDLERFARAIIKYSENPIAFKVKKGKCSSKINKNICISLNKEYNEKNQELLYRTFNKNKIAIQVIIKSLLDSKISENVDVISGSPIVNNDEIISPVSYNEIIGGKNDYKKEINSNHCFQNLNDVVNKTKQTEFTSKDSEKLIYHISECLNILKQHSPLKKEDLNDSDSNKEKKPLVNIKPKKSLIKKNMIEAFETVTILSSEKDDFLIGNKLNDKTYISLIVRKMLEIYPCVLIAKWKTLCKQFWTFVFKCKFTQCRTYKLVYDTTSNSNDIILKLFYDKNNIDHIEDGRLTRPLRGVERSLAKKKLLTMYPSEYKMSELSGIDRNKVEQGNLQSIKSESVFKKARSETLNDQDLSKDDIFDLFNLMLEEEKTPSSLYIHELKLIPFSVYCCSDSQLNILKQISKEKITVYIDATGSVVRSPKHITNRIYYYVIVVAIKSYDARKLTEDSYLFPLHEMITSKHDVFSILSWLIYFKKRFEKKFHEWKCFSNAVTDFSYVFLNGLSEGWNNLRLIDYINLCYDTVMNNKKLPENIVVLRLCCSHLMHTITKDINLHFEDKSVKKQLKEILASFFNLRNINEIIESYKRLSYILKNKYYNVDVENKLHELKKSVLNDIFLIEEDLTVSEEKDVSSHSSMYKNSKFFELFDNINQNIKYDIENKIIKESFHKNDFYNIEFADLILKKYFSIICLWTCIMDKESRKSNAPVEGYFKNIKQYIHQKSVLYGKPPLKVSRFIKATRNYIDNISQAYHLKIPRSRCTKEIKKNENVEEYPLSKFTSKQECWKTRATKRSSTYFDKKYLNKLRDEKYQNKRKKDSISETDIEILYNKNFKLNQNSIHIKQLCDKKDVNFKYYMAIFKNIYIEFKEFLTLFDEKWIFNSIIEYCLTVLCFDRVEWQVILFEIGSQIIYNKNTAGRILSNEDKEQVLKKFASQINPSTRYIIMPLNKNSSHWVLCILDRINKYFYYFDPLYDDTETFEQYKLIKFPEYLRFGDLNEWERKIMPYPKQDDGVNCGIYVIYYASEIIIKGIITNQKFDPHAYREQILQFILHTNEKFLVNLCSLCGRGQNFENMINCIKCNRKIHRNCDKTIFNVEEYLNDVYECPLCNNFYDEIMAVKQNNQVKREYSIEDSIEDDLILIKED